MCRCEMPRYDEMPSRSDDISFNPFAPYQVDFGRNPIYYARRWTHDKLNFAWLWVMVMRILFAYSLCMCTHFTLIRCSRVRCSQMMIVSIISTILTIEGHVEWYIYYRLSYHDGQHRFRFIAKTTTWTNEKDERETLNWPFHVVHYCSSISNELTSTVKLTQKTSQNPLPILNIFDKRATLLATHNLFQSVFGRFCSSESRV